MKRLAETLYGAVYREEATVLKRSLVRQMQDVLAFDDPYREIRALECMGPHPCIIGYRGATITPEVIDIRMEYAEYGDLFAFLEIREILEAEPRHLRAQQIMRQVGEALLFMHEEKKLSHLDMSLENILVLELTPENAVKRLVLTDFGSTVSSQLKLPVLRSMLPGKRHYSAPELMWVPKQQDIAIIPDTQAIDIFALGVILFELLMQDNRRPFETCRHSAYRERFLKQGGIVSLLAPDESLSPYAANLIDWCLQPDPAQRPTIRDFLAHAFFEPMPPQASATSSSLAVGSAKNSE